MEQSKRVLISNKKGEPTGFALCITSDEGSLWIKTAR